MNRIGMRFWEVDAVRGIAVIGMVLFHLAFDLDYLGIWRVDVRSGAWLLLAQATALTFALLVGVSLSISSSWSDGAGLTCKLFKRGVMIFSLGLIITLVTYVVVGTGFVIFGVLHLIGLSIIISRPFLFLGWKNLPSGLALIALGISIQDIPAKTPWLIWLGLAPANFYTLDYLPLLPWFGVVLLGIFAGSIFYPGGMRRFGLMGPAWGSNSPAVLAVIGRNSLVIYLAHQPLMIGILYLLGLVPQGSLPSIPL